MDRQRPTGEMDPDALGLGPRSIERPTDVGVTLVGGIDDPNPARVDRGGLLSPAGATWSLDWWIGADDRWYLPAREPSMRQRRIGPGPIIETSMRVPSGDVVATAYPVVAGSQRATVVEIENASPVPVVLGVAIRPRPVDGGPGTSGRIELLDDRATSSLAMTVDGRPAVLLPRSPNERVADRDHDVLDRVEGGQALTWDGPVDGPRANAACLYPLPHATSLRFVVPNGDPTTGGSPTAARFRPDALPPADTVANGWASVIERAGTFGFPDPGLRDLMAAARARLVLAAPGLADRIEAIDHEAALVLEALAVGGHGDECVAAIDRLVEAFPTGLPAETPSASGPAAAAAVVRAAAAAADLHPPARAEALLGSVARLTALVERRGDDAAVAVAKRGLARLADRAGQPDAAEHLRSTRPASSGEVAIDRAEPDLDDLTALAQLASPAGSWPPHDDAATAARFVLLARRLLVDVDHRSADRPVVHLLPSMPSAWLGGQVEVHRAAAAGVRVSFAVRWHGYRPALLWEVTDDGGRQRPLLRCPGLDPDWSSDQPSGETLLAGTPIPLPAAPAPGDSFQ